MLLFNLQLDSNNVIDSFLVLFLHCSFGDSNQAFILHRGPFLETR